uniref:DUF5641 domain-containing protein n=1 Tax=Strigamia maritima TaxID=126957 RepID=T1IKR8_STRMM
DEIESLERKEKIPNSSKIKKYDPFLDKQGFLRVGGRLKQSLLSEEEKHPKFLHPLSGVTKLLIMKTHQKLLHEESTEVMFTLREKYWILKGRRAIRSRSEDLLPSIAILERYSVIMRKPFQKGSRELTAWGYLLASKGIQKVLTNRKIEWSFIAPLSPWWGGRLERMVRSTWEYEEFDTLCKEINAVINSRPLSYVVESETNQLVLTPEHFLTGGLPKYLLRKPAEKIKNKDLIRIERQRKRNLIEFWKYWKKAYLMQLRNFHETRGNQEESGVREGRVVLVEKVTSNPYFWPLARVVRVFPSIDGIIRSAEVRLSDGTILVRPVKWLRILEAEEPTYNKITYLKVSDNLRKLIEPRSSKVH